MKLWGKCGVALALSLLVMARAPALADTPKSHVLPGAFGREGKPSDYADYVNPALKRLLADFEARTQDAVQYGTLAHDGYLQILQTTLYAVYSPPDYYTSDVERMIWREYYDGVRYIVSFLVIDNLFNMGSVSYATYSGRFHEYAVKDDGTVMPISLRQIQSRTMVDPVTRDVEVINLGDAYNKIYIVPVEEVGQAGIPLFAFISDPDVSALASGFEACPPASVSVVHAGELSGTPVVSSDPEVVRAVFHALSEITVLGESDQGTWLDDELIYRFMDAGGAVVAAFLFQDGRLLDNRLNKYDITGFDALQAVLPDPGF